MARGFLAPLLEWIAHMETARSVQYPFRMPVILTALFWIVQDTLAFTIGFLLATLHKNH
jgi:hypothetical protein